MKVVQDWWSDITPSSRKTIVTVGLAIVGIIILYLFVTATPEQQLIKKREKSLDENILTGSDPKVLGVDAMGANIADQQKQIEKLLLIINENEKQNTANMESYLLEITKLTRKVDNLKNSTREQIKGISEYQKSAIGKIQQTFSEQTQGLKGELEDVLTRQENNKQGTIDAQSAREEGLFNDGSVDESIGSSYSVSDAKNEKLVAKVFGEEEILEQEDPENDLYVPPTSIISGLLINGADVPAGLRGKKDPIPVLMRIKHEAILPNRFHADIRECFVILASKADMSTERVHFRGETMACVRNDGGIVESEIDSYVTGGDGKTGIRGTLVHRASSLVFKAAAAGFLSAFGSAFQPAPIATLNTSPGTTQEYQNPDVSKAVESGAYGGIKEAGTMLSEYFLDLAEEVLPFLEIQAGTKLDMVLVKGLTLKNLAKTTKAQI